MTQNAGELRHRIMVQKLTSGKDDDGYPIPEQWVDYMPLWAKVTHLSGKDLIAAQASNSKVVARVKIRYREDINTAMRVIYKGKTYAIDSQALEDTNTGYESVTFLLSTM
ncbi:phage head closure protein [Acinetobacter sp. YH12063]|uniref:phage head closure protein n=1 Tax=Acinetobacter sp. YH12063 TaxID=2601061 RepID=UPI0015D1F51A|nr:phage head closure protein [Acinetobacter sp. YH12063]